MALGKSQHRGAPSPLQGGVNATTGSVTPSPPAGAWLPVLKASLDLGQLGNLGLDCWKSR